MSLNVLTSLIPQQQSLMMAQVKTFLPFWVWAWWSLLAISGEMMPTRPGLACYRTQVCVTLPLSLSRWLQWDMLLRTVLDHRLTAMMKACWEKHQVELGSSSHWTEASDRITWAHTMRQREISCICLHPPPTSILLHSSLACLLICAIAFRTSYIIPQLCY